MVLRSKKSLPSNLKTGGYTMNCLCNIFDEDNIIWLIIIALLIWCCSCNN